MAWEWSHTVEGLEGARARLGVLDRETLIVIYAEWEARAIDDDVLDSGREPGFDREAYDAALIEAARLPDDVLADAIWAHAESASTCDNGGHSLWMCPWGCGPHCVAPESMEASS